MSRQPYPGLRPFEEDEYDIFFGRDKQIDMLLEHLNKTHFIAIAGPSGYGKSSLVITGLLSALETGFLPEAGNSWRIALCRPGHQPFAHLVRALLSEDVLGKGFTKQLNHYSMSEERNPIDSEFALLQTLLEQGGPRSLIDLFNDLCENPENLLIDNALLLVIDQFEEIFRHAEQGTIDQAVAFVELLLASSEHRSIFVILVMRSDFIGDCTQFYGLAEAINQSLFLVPRLTREQLHEAIIRPAQIFGGKVELALITRLLNDVVNNPNQLPVLQHTLMRMWDLVKTEEQPILTLAHYELIGGFHQALSLHADEAFAELTAEQQHIAAILFKSLTARGRGQRDTRRSVALHEVVALVGSDSVDSVIHVVNVFRANGRHFLIPPVDKPLEPDSILDIGHESLIWLWQRLQHWVADEADSAELYLRLEDAVLRYEIEQGALWRTPDLEQALSWRETFRPTEVWARRYGRDQGQYFGLAMRFLDSSVAAQQAEQRSKRRLLWFVSGLVISAVLFALVATWMRSESYQQQQTALRTQSWFLADLAYQQLDKKNVLTATRLALHALPSTEQPYRPLVQEAQLVLFDAVQHFDTILPHNALVRAAMFSPDGTQLLTATSNQVWLWDIKTQTVSTAMLQGHEDRVSHAVYNAAGTQLVTSSWDNTARLWDAQTGAAIAVLQGHEDDVNHAAYNAAGTQLVTVSDDRTARLWDAQTGKAIAVLQGHKFWVTYAAYNAAGTQLVTVSRDKTARLWDAQTGKAIAVLQEHEADVNHAAYNAAGTQLVTVSRDNTARLWDAQTGVAIAVLQGHEDAVWYAAYNAAGTQLVTVSRDKTARLWDAQTGEAIAVLQGHEGSVYHAAYNAAGTQLVTVSRDKTARLWDAQTGKAIAVLQGHEGPVYHVAYNAAGAQLMTVSRDNTARLWDAQTGKAIAVLQGHESSVYHVVYNAVGTQLVTVSRDKTARLWDAQTGAAIAMLQGHEDAVWYAAYNTTGTQLVTVSRDDTARLWDAQTGEAIAVLQGHESTVYHAAYNAVGTQLVTVSDDNTARLWDAQTGKAIAVLQGHENVVSYTVYNAAGTQLVTVSDDKTARLWDAQTGKAIAVLQGHEDVVWFAAYNAAGTQLVTLSDDNTARLWDAQTGKAIAMLQGTVYHAWYNVAGTQLVTTSGDNTARLWDAQTGAAIAMLQGHEDRVSHAAYNAAGTQLVTISDDKTARLWDAQTGKAIAVLQGHEDRVSDVEYNAAGTQLVTLSYDKTARLWDARTGKLIAVLPNQKFPKFSPDGKQLITLSTNNEIRRWQLFPDLDSMIKEAEHRTRYHSLTCEQRKQFFLLDKSVQCK